MIFNSFYATMTNRFYNKDKGWAIHRVNGYVIPPFFDTKTIFAKEDYTW